MRLELTRVGLLVELAMCVVMTIVREKREVERQERGIEAERERENKCVMIRIKRER